MTRKRNNEWTPDVVPRDSTRQEMARLTDKWAKAGTNFPHMVVEVGAVTVSNVGMYTHGMLDHYGDKSP